VALETLLELPPLHTFIVKDAALTSYRLFTDIRPKPGDYKGHLKIYEKFPNLVGVLEVSDRIPVEIETEPRFDIIIPDRKDWVNGLNPVEEDSLVFYTDGSRKDGSTGGGIFGPGIRAWFPMGTMATVFEAEVFAIDACARRCLERKSLRNKKITIASDSQASLKALGSTMFKSKLVLECRKNLNALGKRNHLKLVWVPGHTGISGNEAADLLAKKGSETKFIGPEPCCGFGLGHRDKMINEWEKKEMLISFKSLSIDSHSRHLITIEGKKAEEALSLNTDDLRLLVGILTGHCGLNAFQHRIGKSDDNLCRLCKNQAETPLHFLSECEAVERKRKTSFDKGNPSILDLRQMKFHQILTFFKKLDLGNI
jgi:ribonuclease HI